MQSFSAQTPNEAPTLAYEFTARLALTGRTIDSCEVTAAMYERTNATDSNPSATLDGAAQLNAEPFELETPNGTITVPAGAAVLQAILPGRVIGGVYVYRFLATCNDGSVMEEDAVQSVTEYAAP
jgi:hypothetical protein